MTACQTSASTDDILISGGDDGVVTITFNRPAQRNAMTFAMEARFLQALRDAENDPAVRVVVVTGAGDAFCAGADLAALDVIAENPGGTGSFGSDAAAPLYLLTCRKPLVAAINGACVGLGLSIALYADIRIASNDAKIASAFARRGLIAEYGSAWLLPRIVGRANALDLLLSGRTILGEEAYRMGLVQRVLPTEQVLPAALGYARDLAENSSPTSMAIIKEQVNQDGGRSIEPAMRESLVLMLESFSRPDLAEGMAAHLQQRPPAFAPWQPPSA